MAGFQSTVFLFVLFVQSVPFPSLSDFLKMNKVFLTIPFYLICWLTAVTFCSGYFKALHMTHILLGTAYLKVT